MKDKIDPVVEQVMGDWLEVLEATEPPKVPLLLRVARQMWGRK